MRQTYETDVRADEKPESTPNRPPLMACLWGLGRGRYQELNDPAEQRLRFQAQARDRDAGDAEAQVSPPLAPPPVAAANWFAKPPLLYATSTSPLTPCEKGVHYHRWRN